MKRLLSCLAALLVAGFASDAAPPLSAAEKAQVNATLLSAISQGLPAMGASRDDAQTLSAVMDFAAMQFGSRAAPHDVDRLWGIAPPPPPTAASLADARNAGVLQHWLDALTPPFQGYRNLMRVRRTYAAYAAAGGWPQMPGGRTLREGDEDSRVETLRRRLSAEGFGPAELDSPALFDADLTSAVSRFQVAHGIEADGVVGPHTLGELNVTAAQRLDQIDANLERWRWLPRPLPSERIEVDVAAAEAVYFAADHQILRMKIVVGDLAHRTPLFYSAVSSIVINPPWNVPQSIAEAEILPKAAADRGYLARNHFRYVDGRLQQAPGPGSALGVLKFDFPSPYGVYLHDTPAKAAFALTRRTLSHGCMRLEKPRELAMFLLGRQGWSVADIDAAIASGQTQRVQLQQTIPLFLVYRTAVGLDDGAAVFRPDVYGWDRKLTAALKASPIEMAAAPALTASARTPPPKAVWRFEPLPGR